MAGYPQFEGQATPNDLPYSVVHGERMSNMGNQSNNENILRLSMNEGFKSTQQRQVNMNKHFASTFNGPKNRNNFVQN